MIEQDLNLSRSSLAALQERLPIKTIEGRVIRQLEKLPTREEQAEERRKEWEEDQKRRAEQAEARQKKKEEEEEAEEEEDDFDEEDGLLDEEVVERPLGEGGEYPSSQMCDAWSQ